MRIDKYMNMRVTSQDQDKSQSQETKSQSQSQEKVNQDQVMNINLNQSQENQDSQDDQDQYQGQHSESSKENRAHHSSKPEAKPLTHYEGGGTDIFNHEIYERPPASEYQSLMDSNPQ